MLSSHQWTDLSTRDFAALDWRRVVVVAPFAAVEQHGPHLPVGVDTQIMRGCIDRIICRLPSEFRALFLPVLSIGVSTEHRDFPGTLSLSPTTALNMLLEIAGGTIKAGARKLVLVSSHGGNSATIAQAALELRARESVLAVTVSLSRFGYPDGLFAPEEARHGIHGGDIETSLMLAFRPELVDMTQARNFPSAARDFESDFTWLRADRPAGFGWMAQDLSSAGVVGDAAKATVEKGAATADHWAKCFVELLHDIERFDLSRLSAAD